MKTLKQEFTNRQGHKISALLDLPLDRQPRAYALFAHCFTCSKNLTAVKNISLGLTQEGIAVFRFDFTGLGSSEGNFADTNFSTNVQDLVDAAAYVESEFASPSLIIGHSLGGAAVLQAAVYIEAVQTVAVIAAPADPPHVKKLLREGIDEINASGEATVDIGGRPFKIKKQFLDDLEQHSLNVVMDNLRKPLLILHSPQDRIVGIDNASQIYLAAHHPKSFISLDGADHLLSNQGDSHYAGQMIANWTRRYLERNTQPLQTDEQVVTRTGAEGYTTEVVAGKHHLLIDEPAELGGLDLGPTPYDYLVAALGACTGITLRMYADHKKIPLEEVKVHLSHEKRHADDCEDVENKGSKLDHIDRQIELLGESLTQEQRARLLEIADKCPVHKTLHSEVVINSTLKD